VYFKISQVTALKPHFESRKRIKKDAPKKWTEDGLGMDKSSGQEMDGAKKERIKSRYAYFFPS
jgi:hypothetical protein